MGDKIKQRILELVPDAGESFGIAVVLRAIGKEHPHVTVEANGTIGHYSGIRWNLKKDSYNDQTEEVRAFIGTLLGVK